MTDPALANGMSGDESDSFCEMCKTPYPSDKLTSKGGIIGVCDDCLDEDGNVVDRSPESDSDWNPPTSGGCWICETGDGYEDADMEFDPGFDTYVHSECLDEHDVESVLAYEQREVNAVDEYEDDSAAEVDQEPKPCGAYHPLPCGLDKACKVPVDFFDAELDSDEVWDAYMDDA